MIFRFYLALILLMPLPLAAVHTWVWSLVACIVAVMLIAWAGTLALRGQAPAVGIGHTWTFALPFVLAVVWAVVQMLPATPPTWHHSLWQETAQALGAPKTGSVSLDPFETGSAVLRLLTYAGIFWLALQYCRLPDRASQVIHALSLAGLIYASYGLVIQFSGANMVLWFQKTAYVGSLTSTFINRNSYAAYAGLGLICTSAAFIQLVVSAGHGDLSRREKTRRVVESLSARGWLYLVAWVILATALVLTGSRGGLLCAALGLGALFLCVGLTQAIRLRHAILIALPLLLLGLAFFFYSGEITAKRLTESNVALAERAHVYQLTSQGIEEHPIFGVGYGTFLDAFRFYRDEAVDLVFDKAHNTYLENALELGIPAAVLLFVAIFALFVHCILGVRRRRRHEIYACVGIAATLQLAVHSLIDFSLQIPAVAATYAMIMGMAAAQSWGSTEKL